MKQRWLTALTMACVFALLGSALGDDAKADLKVGEKAPTFQATDDQGKDWKSTEHVGKQIVVVYFYPADFTGGCTKQACGFRDDYSKIADKGAMVVGISGDSAKTHKLFKEHHKLPHTLLADENGALAKLFGVPVGKGGEVTVKELDNLKIKQGVRAQRWTFVIDKNGNIAYKDPKVNAAEDSKKILDLVEKLNK
jgi:peroxiredoxin Q/BCP